jgi:malate dehydrogenase
MACEHPTDSGSCFSAAISSDGAYDVPEGLICGFPLMRMDDGSIEIKRDLSLSNFAKKRIQISVDELLSEKEAVKHLMK